MIGLLLATLIGCQDMTVTAYSQEQFPGATYSGEPTVPGVTAAASWNIPLATTVWIEGYGERRINDRGRLGSTGHVDILVATTREALQIGRSTRQVCH